MAENKIPYEPSSTKRFEVSKDTFSRERIKALVETVREIRSRHPFIVGTVLFGSLSKGKDLTEDTEDKSDIDTVVYIDEDETRKEYPSLSDGQNERFNELVEIDNELHANYDGRTEDEKMFELVGNYVAGIVENSLREKLPHHELFKPLKNIGVNVKAISFRGENSINQTIDNIFFSYLSPNDSKLDRLRRAKEDLESEKPKLSILSICDLAMPWSLNVGGGLEKYRRSFLAQLREYGPEERDLRWGIIGAAVKYYERKANIPESIESQYPDTYGKAVRHYGVYKEK